MEHTTSMAGPTMQVAQLIECLETINDGSMSAPSVGLAQYLATRLREREDVAMGARQFYDFAVVARENLAEGTRSGQPIDHPMAGDAQVFTASIDEIADVFLDTNRSFGERIIMESCQ